jgi:acetolactate synthase-1/2/3 large subunit
MEALKDAGYTTCFFLGGGNSMHLLESASQRFKCIPVVHEVTASISVEYFNQTNLNNEKAFALVTAGPGMTNLVTGVGGAWLDSRELLIVGGQAKSSNLARNLVRQIGHQEIDGQAILNPITKVSKRIEAPVIAQEIYDLVSQSWIDRPGPVFLEVCLDVTATDVDLSPDFKAHESGSTSTLNSQELESLKDLIFNSERPLILLGGGVSKSAAVAFEKAMEGMNLPIACTWTGADRVTVNYKDYAGRPNTYGMRWANIFQQQADLIIAVGTSLGFQQTGFNTQNYAPLAKIVHVDIDKNEITKSNPRPRIGFICDSTNFLNSLTELIQNSTPDFSKWSNFLEEIKKNLPTLEDCQKTQNDYLSPHEVISQISKITGDDDVVVAASSGGTFTATLQQFEISGNQRLLCNKGLASMGYGLAGAIGAAVARKGRTILFEGDGGFAQNMQDLGTVRAQKLNIKIFITSNDGYASIKTSQKTYFSGHYIGCDEATGLQLPNWEELFKSFGIICITLEKDFLNDPSFKELWTSDHPSAFIIKSDPEQLYLPKIFSKVDTNGIMTSTALHDMSPPLESELSKKVFNYLPTDLIPSSA